tara:strand:+ start:238 stop:912 length:675 start_codon:yes stop_codon:yes gene_type:complete
MNDYDFTISSYCNAACPSCKRHLNYLTTSDNTPVNPALEQIHMPYLSFENIIKNNDEFRNSNVSFEGEFGDPIIHPDITKFIHLGSRTFSRLDIVTNGGLRKPEWYAKIGNEYSNVYFTFSIDGLIDETNLYRVNVNTKKAIDNLIAYKQTKYGEGNHQWKYIVFEHNAHEIQDVVNFASERDLNVSFKINVLPRYKIKQNSLQKVNDILSKTNYSNDKAFGEL